MNRTAILLTCFNRKEKTLQCLKSLYEVLNVSKDAMSFDIYLVDDGSTDGTSEAITTNYPEVKIIKGSGVLFWSGGMRLAWQSALQSGVGYDFFLLLNDDVKLLPNFLDDLMITHSYCKDTYKKSGIYVSSTKDPANTKASYGGTIVKWNLIKASNIKVAPSDKPQLCTMANANILMVTKDVVDAIGILDEYYTHQFGDYDYTLAASKNNIPVLVCPGFGGICDNDHGNSWLPANSTLKGRLKYLYSPLGLAYHEQLYYLKKNFKWQFPYYFSMLWLKTLFPFIWDKFKTEE